MMFVWGPFEYHVDGLFARGAVLTDLVQTTLVRENRDVSIVAYDVIRRALVSARSFDEVMDLDWFR